MRTIYVAAAILVCSAPLAQARQTEADPTPARKMVLEGVIVSSHPGRSVALVRQPDSSYAHAVKIGETIFGYEILEISDDGVTARLGNEVLRLSLSGEWKVETVPSAVAGVDSPPGISPRRDPDGVRKELRRSMVEQRLSDEMPRILTQTGLTPRVVEGEVRGFRITRLPKGTVLDDAGIHTGDVLLSINEIPMNSPYTLIDLYPRLQSEDEIRVVLERAGKTLTLVYSFN
jgi:general secretion pathway protein C